MLCAIVTGAGTGTGAAVAQRLHRDGHGVVLTGRRREPLEDVARELEEAVVVEADAGEAADAERTVSAAVERFGGYVNGVALPVDGGTTSIDPTAVAFAKPFRKFRPTGNV